MNLVFNALSHNIRRRIILMIGNHGSVSYTDMTSLDLEPGTLYFHLDILTKSEEPLVERTGNKRYTLTELGHAAYGLILQGEDEIQWVSSKRTETRWSGAIVSNALGMSVIIRRIQSDPWRFWLEILLFLGGYGYLASRVGLLPVFLFFVEGTFDLGISILAAFSAWLVTYLLVEALSIPILGKREFSRGLFMTVPIAFLPNVVIELLWFFIPATEILVGWPLTIILTAAIAWSTYILTIAVARAKTVRLSRAAIVTLVVTNANLFLLAFLNVVFLT
ncbi:MAG: winged helix-turn-helix domain-containing protein [Candidatus Thorarchaeota archaeon]